MSVFVILQLALLSVTVACFPLIIYWLRKAAKYNEITRKLYAQEPLTAREQRLLDKVDQ